MIEYFLFFMFVASNVWWMYICNRLINRVMSRNYQEFLSGERQKKPTNVSARPQVALVDPIAENNARMANSLFT
jgi:hypothetical protein